MLPLSMKKFDMFYRGVCDGDCNGDCICRTTQPELKAVSALEVLETIHSDDFYIVSLREHDTREIVNPYSIFECLAGMVKSIRATDPYVRQKEREAAR